MKMLLSLVLILAGAKASAQLEPQKLTCWDSVGADLTFEITETTAVVTATHVGLKQTSCYREPSMIIDGNEVVTGTCVGYYVTNFILNIGGKNGTYRVEDTDTEDVVVYDHFACQ